MSVEAGGLPQPQLCLQDRDEGSEKMDLFHIFCDLLASLASCLNLRNGTESWPISYSKQGPKHPKSGPRRTACPGDKLKDLLLPQATYLLVETTHLLSQITSEA